MSHIAHIRQLFLSILGLVMIHAIQAQKSVSSGLESESPDFNIRWVSVYPASKEENKEQVDNRSRRDFRWFSDLVLGKKPNTLIKPMSQVAANPDTIWIADQGSGRILKVSGLEGEIIRFRNSDTEKIPSMVGSCLMPGRMILFTDSELNRIFRFKDRDNRIDILNDSLELNRPTGIAYSRLTGEIWVVETGAHRITILDNMGRMIKRFGERGDGPGQFNFPTYLWIDGQGTVFVVDAMNFRVQMFNSMGNYLSEFGEAGDASGYLSRPKGIATDSYGHIYIADALFHVVQVFDRDGQFLYAFGSPGEGREQFWMPTGIFIDEQNYIYISDSYNSRVQVFQLTAGE